MLKRSPVKFTEMIDCQEEAEEDGHDPEEVEDVVSVGALDHRTRGTGVDLIRVCCQAAAEEGGPEVDGDRGEPDHEQGEQAALAGVGEEEADVFGAVLGSDGSAVEHRGEEAYLVCQQSMQLLQYLLSRSYYGFIMTSIYLGMLPTKQTL